MTTRTPSLLAAAAACVLAGGALWAQGSAGDTTGPGSGGLAFQPVLGAPADGVRLIGAARQGAAGEVWGVSAKSGSLLRYTREAGAWQLVPFAGDQGADLGVAPDWATADVNDRGGVALLARASAAEGPAGDGRLAVSGDGGFAVAPLPPSESTEPEAEAEPEPEPPAEERAAAEPAQASAAAEPVPAPVLMQGERLLPPQNGADGSGPALVATAEEGGAGALVLPHRDGSVRAPVGVLRYDRREWTREPVCLDENGPDGCSTVAVLGAPQLAAAPSGAAWLLGSVRGRPLLFQRVSGDGRAPRWLGRRPQSWLLDGAAPPDAGAIVAARKLTATDQGLWLDVSVTGTVSGSATVLVDAAAPDGAPLGTWCQPLSICPGASGALAAPLPEGDYGSDAFPGGGAGDAGVRIIGGLPNGALQRLRGGGAFEYLVGGGSGGQSAAFTAPDDGWLTIAGAPQLTRVTTTPEASRLTAWPVPFRYPLLAVTPAPASTPGDAAAAALAVGDRGQVARYKPGEGWLPEYVYGANGARAMPRLRAVAWPEPGRAFAVGDEGAMWVWRAETGLWESDPAKPLNFHGNLGGIAFAPSDPNVGYAVGKQGVLLGYGRTWTQQALPPGLEQEHFTSVAFAGGQALAVHRHGLLVNDGGGWRADEQVAALLGRGMLTRVAGLPDGGAVVAGSGIVLERDGPAAPWQRSSQPLPLESAFNVAALSAFRDGAAVRALISVDVDSWSYPDGPGYVEVDQPQPPAPGQPPLYIEADPLPISGFLLRETASGWRDEQHGGFVDRVDTTAVDGPAWPDPVLALAVDAAGDQGWAVGGETGGRSRFGDTTRVQTAGVQRYGSGPAPPAGATSPVGGAEGTIAFALGGAAQCATPCADLANVGIGPDRWLQSALQRAGQIPGLRAFLFAGPRLADSARAAGADAFARELARYGELFRAAAGPLPAYAAITPAELAADGGTAPFATALGTAAPAGTVPSGTPAPPPGTAAYVFDSAGAGGTVRVIVLDFSRGALAPGRGSGACAAGGDPSADQLDWLCAQLDAARAAGVPALVLGSADLREVPDGTAVAASLVARGASAYLFASREKRAADARDGSAHDPRVRQRDARLRRAAARRRRRLPRRGRLPDARRRRRGARRDDERRAGQREPRAQRRTARDRRVRRAAAAAQHRRAVQSARPPPAERQPPHRLGQQPHPGPRSLRPDPEPVHRRGVRRAGPDRVPLQLLQPRHRRLRRARSQLDGSARRAAGRRREAGRRSHLGDLLRVQRRHDGRLGRDRRPDVLAAGDDPARDGAAAVRDGSVGEPAGRDGAENGRGDGPAAGAGGAGGAGEIGAEPGRGRRRAAVAAGRAADARGADAAGENAGETAAAGRRRGDPARRGAGPGPGARRGPAAAAVAGTADPAVGDLAGAGAVAGLAVRERAGAPARGGGRDRADAPHGGVRAARSPDRADLAAGARRHRARGRRRCDAAPRSRAAAARPAPSVRARR